MSNWKRRVDEQTSDSFKAGAGESDAMKSFQEMTRRSWEAFVEQMQKPLGAGEADDVSRSSSTKTSSANVTLDHALAGLKSYADWMQGAAASVSTPQSDWRQQMQQLFGGASQPFSHGFAGADNTKANVFADQWQAWLQSMQKDGGSSAHSQAPFSSGFGFGHEHQVQQQDLAAAISKHLEASQRYQLLMQRSNAQAMEKMQARLAQLAKPGQQIESLKVLYDVWVDCAEEAYAEIALSDEFRETYSEMVNTQIRVRQLQQEQTEYLCQQLGIPTRSDMSSLGERLQAMRREMRSSRATAPENHAEAIAELRREVAALKRQILASKVPAVSARKAAAGKATPKSMKSAVKTSVANKAPPKNSSGITLKKLAKVSASRAKPAARATVRKRK